MPTTAIYALSKDNVFGINNDMPWKIKEDLQFFKLTTDNSILIMGKNTFKSVKNGFPGRIPMVISSDTDLKRYIENIQQTHYGNKIFIIGGSKLLTDAIHKGLCDNLIITKIDKDYNTSKDKDNYVFGPEINFKKYDLISQSEKMTVIDVNTGTELFIYREYYRRKNCENSDTLYNNLVKEVLINGIVRTDRTKIGTISTFGNMSRYDISQGRIPLLTTKYVPVKSVIDELLWFLSGSTDSNLLKSKIWSGNTSREFLDKRGLTEYKTGLIGPAYGFQWRSFGAKYNNETGKAEGHGEDQLLKVLELLKNDPYSRRIIMTAWNPTDSDKMALEPCHILVQFYVTDPDPYDYDSRKWISCYLTQRSGDIGLGVPFNIASYSILCHMIGHILNLRPLEFIHALGDAHIYNNHIYQLKNQINSPILEEPTMKINYQVNKDISVLENLLSIGQNHFCINYNPGPKISMSMAV